MLLKGELVLIRILGSSEKRSGASTRVVRGWRAWSVPLLLRGLGRCLAVALSGLLLARFRICNGLIKGLFNKLIA